MRQGDKEDSSSLLAQLRERQVVKTFVLYVAIGWGFYEIASEILTRFGFEDTIITLLLVFLLLGLPAALFLAWYFDLDRRGIHAESRLTRRDWVIICGALLLPVAGVMVARPYVGGVDSTFDAPATTVAVLPFSNLTGDGSLEYLADGVAEELIATLTRSQAFDISGMTQSFAYRGSEINAQEVGEELNVSWVIRGSVRSSGQLLRFSASIIDTSSGKSVWSDNVEVSQLTVFQGQDQLSSAVTQALSSEAEIEMQPSVAVEAPDPEAYELYLRGRHIWHRRGTVDIGPGISMLSEATRIDPDFAKGWAALASAYITWPSYSREGQATFGSSEEIALKAIELDPRLPEPYAVLASFAQQRRNWIEAHEFYTESLRLDSKNATANYWYGEHLAATGRYAESVRHMREAVRLDPAYQAPKSDLAFSYLTFGAWDLGSTEFVNSWDAGFRNPMNWMGNFIGYVVQGQHDTAREWVAAAPLNETAVSLLTRFVEVEAGGTDSDLVQHLLGDQEARIDHRLMVWLVSRLGDYDATMNFVGERLENGYLVDTRPLWGIGISLYEHERFPALMERLDLVDYWRATNWGDVCRPIADSFICDGHGLNPDALNAVLSTEN